MIGWAIGLLLGLALTTAAIICVVETVVVRPADADGLKREQGSD